MQVDAKSEELYLTLKHPDERTLTPTWPVHNFHNSDVDLSK